MLVPNSMQQSGRTFASLSATGKQALPTEIESKKSGDADVDYFYPVTRKLTIQAYTTAKFYLTKVQVYELVPGNTVAVCLSNKLLQANPREEPELVFDLFGNGDWLTSNCCFHSSAGWHNTPARPQPIYLGEQFEK